MGGASDLGLCKCGQHSYRWDAGVWLYFHAGVGLRTIQGPLPKCCAEIPKRPVAGEAAPPLKVKR
jgi:hypothetical protein